MPARAASLHITDAYRDQMAQLRARTTDIVGRSWAAVTLEDLAGSHAAWLEANTAVVEAAKAAAVALSAGYVAAFVTSETGRRIAAPSSAADPSASVQEGRTVREALGASIIAVRVALATGRPALRAGLVRAQYAAALEVAHTGAHALSGALVEEDRVRGWRRATTPNGCGACLGAATGALRPADERPAAHTFCRCVAEPALRGVTERIHRPTGEQIFKSLTAEQQNALFADSGGKDKADLIRSGRVALADLVAPAPMAMVPDGITERPLADLVR